MQTGRVLTCQTGPPDESDSSNVPVQRVTLVGLALVGRTCPTSEHVGQLVRPDDPSDMSARLVRTGRTSTSNKYLARAVRLASPTTCRTAPLDLETSWAVRQVVEPGCSRTHRAGGSDL
ncbi:hypothetical protein PCANC_10295 [Puccinia coronata f. sp. avenae]|uniref:Uncharacterized protein n=1 Tax=Puccinia coronata f. sp. avenae TaxID=200324 RepID=A0A2N5VQE3_9BASI|nr:hypothetical protein PCANC_10295 [Puccinia coronata f. sp. avenae]